MRVLIAEDDAISRKLLEVNLRRAGHDVVSTRDGAEAWAALRAEDGPRIAVLDWMMPALDGIEVCKLVRAEQKHGYVYLILLTAKTRQEDRAAGFEAGADDYLTKPFDAQDLRARIAVGKRIIKLERALQAKVAELQAARGHVAELQGLLPICMHCKKIRDDDSTWQQLEVYIERHSSAAFTHSLCSDCLAHHYPGFGAGAGSG